jgi:hypothetical protein
MGKIGKFGPQAIDIILYPNNPEAENLTRKIAWMLQILNWKFAFSSPMSGSYQGIKIEYSPSDSKAKEIAEVLAKALNARGIIISEPVPFLEPTIIGEFGAFTGTVNQIANIRLVVGAK